MNKSILNASASLLVLIGILFLMQSCGKDEPCNCGVIANDGIDGTCYWLEIRNDCSGNKKKFCFDEDVWMDNNVGENFCVTNESEW
jgi:hypothetical protein